MMALRAPRLMFTGYSLSLRVHSSVSCQFHVISTQLAFCASGDTGPVMIIMLDSLFGIFTLSQCMQCLEDWFRELVS